MIYLILKYMFKINQKTQKRCRSLTLFSCLEITIPKMQCRYNCQVVILWCFG